MTGGRTLWSWLSDVGNVPGLCPSGIWKTAPEWLRLIWFLQSSVPVRFWLFLVVSELKPRLLLLRTRVTGLGVLTALLLSDWLLLLSDWLMLLLLSDWLWLLKV